VYVLILRDIVKIHEKELRMKTIKIDYNNKVYHIHKEKLSYDAILACYHDQGLCPIKTLAFDSAINTTIGLDIIRTSPSSGTAYDIAGKGIANPDSMVCAIKLALNLA